MTKTTETQFVLVGKIGAPHGVSGWVRITSGTNPVTAINDYSPWYIQGTDGSWQILKLLNTKIQPKGVMALIDGFDSRESVATLTGKQLAVTRDQLPASKDGEIYWADLEGMTVTNKDGVVLGKVDYLFETGSNDVMIVKGEKRHLIPYLKGDIILDVNLDTQEIQVNWDPDF